MDNYKIKVNDEAEFLDCLELFNALGFNGEMKPLLFPTYIYAKDAAGIKHLYLSVFTPVIHQELTLPQLRDLVAQSKSKSIEFLEPQDDGTYKLINWTCMSCPPENFIEVPESAVMALKHHDNDEVFFQSTYSVGLYVTRPKVVWERKSTQEQGLISGADALRALADGKEVEYFDKLNTEWDADTSILPINVFTNGSIKFRLKPRTIKLEIEIPAPFEPKDGDLYWHISPEYMNGYGESMYNDGNVDTWQQFGAWRTEEEIKQVVAALCGALKND